MGNLSNLTDLFLYGNNLNDEIPKELGDLGNLTASESSIPPVEAFLAFHPPLSTIYVQPRHLRITMALGRPRKGTKMEAGKIAPCLKLLVENV